MSTPSGLPGAEARDREEAVRGARTEGWDAQGAMHGLRAAAPIPQLDGVGYETDMVDEDEVPEAAGEEATSPVTASEAERNARAAADFWALVQATRGFQARAQAVDEV